MNIEQYCSVCKAVLAMAVVPTSEGDDDGVVWLRCPRCHGYLPKIGASLAAGTAAAAVADVDEETEAAEGPPDVAPLADMLGAEWPSGRRRSGWNG